MGFYSRYLFPRLMNLSMSGNEASLYRKKVLEEAQGEILEIGFGTGLNLPFYPKEVKKIYSLDVNVGMNPLAMNNIKKSAIQVDYPIGDAQQLPFGDKTFDTVLNTWQKVMADGCQLNRDMEKLIQKAGFRFQILTKEYASGIPKVAGYFYYGIASK
jgi:SAM-dependent methyltransferase